MIRLRGQLICTTDAEQAAVHLHMSAHIAASRAEPACLSFDIAATDDPMVFEVMEAFRDRAGFDAHQARTRISPWWQATKDILRAFRMEELGD
ncbi:MAG: antibiotic biosynthesis monooxygenase [Cypionkella sp.]